MRFTVARLGIFAVFALLNIGYATAEQPINHRERSIQPIAMPQQIATGQPAVDAQQATTGSEALFIQLSRGPTAGYPKSAANEMAGHKTKVSMSESRPVTTGGFYMPAVRIL